MKLIDLTGKVFGELTVVKRSKNDKRNQTYWECLCSCGKIKTVRGSHLKDGTSSCGHVGIQKLIERSTKHGYTVTNKDMFKRWHSILYRTTNENDKCYSSYGGRGIKMCEEWTNSFEKFLEDVGEPPFEGAELDRIDNDGNYCKENVRWITEQQNIWNKGSHLNVTSKYKGVSYYKTRGNWVARFSAYGKGFTVGYYETEDMAGLAHYEVASKVTKEFAYLNKIPEGIKLTETHMKRINKVIESFEKHIASLSNTEKEKQNG